MRTFRTVSRAHSSSKSLVMRPFLSLKLPFNWIIIVCQHISTKTSAQFTWINGIAGDNIEAEHLFSLKFFRRSWRPLRRDRHRLPVFLSISTRQLANSLHFGPEKRIRPVRTEQATRSEFSSQLNILDWESRRVGPTGSLGRAWAGPQLARGYGAEQATQVRVLYWH